MSARDKLLEAATDAIRHNGYGATTVDALCAQAGVTKGAFFHHFKSKEALGVAAAEHWSETTGALFAAAPFHGLADPLDRVLAYLDFRKSLIAGAPASYTCLVGTMVQEAYEKHPAIRDACYASISGHAATLEADLAAAIARAPDADCTATELALHVQAVLQGAFILAKGKDSGDVAISSIEHLQRYLRLLLAPETPAQPSLG